MRSLTIATILLLFSLLSHAEVPATDAASDAPPAYEATMQAASFLKIIEKPEVFDPKRKFKTWVFSVANNMLINEYKRRSVRSHGSDAPLDQFIGSNGHYRYHDQDRFIEALNALIVRFKPETQTLFFLRFREEMAVPEISEIMNVKEGTIKSRLHHLTKKLAVGLDEFKDLNHN